MRDQTSFVCGKDWLHSESTQLPVGWKASNFTIIRRRARAVCSTVNPFGRISIGRFITEGRAMPEFQAMFVESRGQPIVYQGKTLVMCDYFPTKGSTTFRLVIEACNGSPVQNDSASMWSSVRGSQHRTDSGFFRTSEDGLAPWRDLEPPGRWRQAVSIGLVAEDGKGKWRRSGGSL